VEPSEPPEGGGGTDEPSEPSDGGEEENGDVNTED
jgi:hypothetical protein